MNSDGASNLTLRSGVAGGLIRDSKDNWILGFQRKLGVAAPSIIVECWVLRDGLHLALERNLQGLIVESGNRCNDSSSTPY